MTSYPHRVLRLASSGEERVATIYRNPALHVWTVVCESFGFKTTQSYRWVEMAEKAASDFVHEA